MRETPRALGFQKAGVKRGLSSRRPEKMRASVSNKWGEGTKCPPQATREVEGAVFKNHLPKGGTKPFSKGVKGNFSGGISGSNKSHLAKAGSWNTRGGTGTWGKSCYRVSLRGR